MIHPRILYWSQHRAFGSAERYIFDLANSVGEYGFEVHLVCPADPVLDAYHLLDEMRGVKIHWIDTKYYDQNALASLPYWVRLFNNLQPSIVHFNDPCLVGGVAAQIARIPHRLMMHHTPELIRSYNLMGKVFEYLAFHSYTQIIFSNKLSMASGIKIDEIPAEKCVVIPFGLDLNWFDPIDPTEIARTRQEFNLNDTDVLVLCPARLSRQKRHDLLVEAAKQVTAQAKNVVFLLAGEGELQDDISRWIANAGLTQKMHLLGFRNDIRTLISASDLVVLSSDFEGFPYVLMESAARGIPAVSTDVGGVRDAIRNGETGLIVPPGEPHFLAKALLALINNPQMRQQFASAARAYAETTFTKQRLVENTIHFYRSLLNPAQLEGI